MRLFGINSSKKSVQNRSSSESIAYKSDLRKVRVCLVLEPERLGYFTDLYKALMNHNFEITLAFLKGDHEISFIKSICIDIPKHIRIEIISSSPFVIYGEKFRQAAYTIYLWLRKRPHDFDVIFFSSSIGYYPILAKSQGILFEKVIMGVVNNDPSAYLRFTRLWLPRVSDFEAEYAEEKCVEFADVLLCSNPDGFRWMQDYNWPLENIFYFNKPSEIGLFIDDSIKKKNSILNKVNRRSSLKINRKSLPFVSVCLTHYNRPDYLVQAIDSLEKQTYKNFEVILIDDGSTNPEALILLKSLKNKFDKFGWKIVRQENSYLGAARNRGILESSGEYILIMDDDNVAFPTEIEMLVKVALKKNLDIVTCPSLFFSTDSPPNRSTKIDAICAPLGGSIEAGFFTNCLGDANSLFRKSCFLSLGGYTTDRDVGHEDWEFYSKAVLAGFRLEPVPEALYWYRVKCNSMVHTTPWQANFIRSARPYKSKTDDKFFDVLLASIRIYHEEKEVFPSLNNELDSIKNSLTWRTITRIDSVVNSIMPIGSVARRVYDKSLLWLRKSTSTKRAQRTLIIDGRRVKNSSNLSVEHFFYSEELPFWKSHINGKSIFQTELKKSLDLNLRKDLFPKDLLKVINDLKKHKSEIRVLEVGSGPLSTLAWGVDQGLFSLIAVDPLADEYISLLKKRGINYPVVPIKGFGENLVSVFDIEKFDVVYCRNALDHTQDPPRVIANMFDVLKTGGVLFIESRCYEGTAANWQGLHKWDLVPKDRSLICISKDGTKTNLNAYYPLECVHYKCDSPKIHNWFSIAFKRKDVKLNAPDKHSVKNKII